MNTLQQMLSVAPVLGLITVLEGQQDIRPEPIRVQPEAQSLQEAVGLAPDGQGGFRAVALAYKATLSADSVEFTPMLGELAPHNLPLQLATRSVHRGGALLHRAVPVVPSMQDLRVVYERGACTETYDVTPRGLKQSFVFDAPVGGDGDLVVRCDWTSELEPTQRGDGAVDFVWPEIGGVRVDSVVGIDAAGRRCDGEVRLAGGALEFVLPDAFVDAATFPLVLDPLIGSPFAVAIANTQQSDVAYMPVALSGESLFVFQARASTVDYDVLAQRRNSAGSLVGGLVVIDNSALVTRRPRVAGVAANGRWLVVWQSATSIFGPYDIRCCAVDAGTGAVSAFVNVTTTATNEFDAAVGGEATTADDEAIVTWCTDTELLACQVTLAASGAPFVFDVTTIGTGSTFRQPAIAKVCSATGRTLIVWEELGEIRGRHVSRDLTVYGAGQLISGANAGCGQPSCDGAADSYLVCWSQPEAPGAANRDVACARVSGSTLGLTVTVPGVPVASLAGRDESEPDVALVGLRYALVLTRKTTSITDKVIVAAVNPDCTTCGVIQQNFGPTGSRHGSPRISSRFVSISSSDDALISYTESLDTPPFTSFIVGQRYALFGSGITPTNLLGGCALGGTNTTTGGPFVIGNPNFAFRVTGADPAALLFLNLGLPSGGLLCGSCTYTNPIGLELKTNVGGTATSVFALPCDPSLVNFQLESQWISFGTAFTPCPLLAGISASNRLLFTLSN
jgi:hypothetical protein